MNYRNNYGGGGQMPEWLLNKLKKRSMQNGGRYYAFGGNLELDGEGDPKKTPARFIEDATVDYVAVGQNPGLKGKPHDYFLVDGVPTSHKQVIEGLRDAGLSRQDALDTMSAWADAGTQGGSGGEVDLSIDNYRAAGKNPDGTMPYTTDRALSSAVQLGLSKTTQAGDWRENKAEAQDKIASGAYRQMYMMDDSGKPMLDENGNPILRPEVRNNPVRLKKLQEEHDMAMSRADVFRGHPGKQFKTRVNEGNPNIPSAKPTTEALLRNLGNW